MIVARDADEARDAVTRIMINREFGEAGDRIVIEECLQGVEASYIVFTDGETILPAVAARDHKAAFDNDSGPNTGGMGAYSTNDILGPELESDVLKRVIRPVISGMKEEGFPFQGILYAGLMLTSRGLRFWNSTSGWVILKGRLFCLGSGAISPGCARRCVRAGSRGITPNGMTVPQSASCWLRRVSGPYLKGKVITGLKMAEEDRRVAIFHAGTRAEGDNFVTEGGRVPGDRYGKGPGFGRDGGL